MRTQNHTILLVVVLMGMVWPAQAVTVNLYPAADTYIDQANPTLTPGAESLLAVSKSASSQLGYGLIKFPIGLMRGATVSSATLTLYLDHTGGSAGAPAANILLRYLNGDWDEPNTSWNNQPAIGSNYISKSVSGAGPYTVDVTSPVQAWAGGTRTNYGFLLSCGTTDCYKYFASREASDSNQRPRLSMTYTAPDISTAHINLSVEAMLWGEGFTVDTAIRNSAGVTSKVKYYLSADKIIDSNDTLLRTWNVSAGATSERVSLTLPQTPIPGIGREMYIGIIADADGEVFETNENNNGNQGFGIDYRRINVGPPDAWADGSSYKYYTMLSPELADCKKYSGYQFKDPAGTSNNTWSVTSGSLPPGVVMSSAGFVSGNPSTPGTYSFTLRAQSTASNDFDCQMVVHPSRSAWFEDAKLGYWTMIYSSNMSSASVIDSENVSFDANAHMAQLAASGAKYVVFYAFGIPELRFWPSEIVAGYSQKTTRDYVKEIIDAGHAQGIKVLMYMGIDPHHPGEFTLGNYRTIPEFLKWHRMLYQELLLKGADGFWFDGSYFNREDLNGGANGYWPWDWASMEAAIRVSNPEAILINNPGAVTTWWNTDDHGWYRLYNSQRIWEPASDIDVRTYEQFTSRTKADPPATVPSGYNFNPISSYNYFMIPWAQDPAHTLWPKHIPAESAGMVGKEWSWGASYLPVKTANDLIHYLIKCWDAASTVSLCTGPMQNGVFDTTESTTLTGIGNWMNTYGAAAYQTRQGPRFTGNAKLYSTIAENGNAANIYVFVLDYDKPAGTSLVINNWALQYGISRCYSLDNPSVSLPFSVNGAAVTVQNITWSTGPATVLCFEAAQLNNLFYDGFEDGIGSAWINSGVSLDGANEYAGIRCARLNSSDILTHAMSTCGHENITLSYWLKIAGFTGIDHFYCEWYDGAAWQVVEDVTVNAAYTRHLLPLPAGAAKNPQFAFRFRVAGASGTFAYVDEVNVIGAAAPFPVGDLTQDCIVDIADMNALANTWLNACSSANNWCQGSDIDQSGRVDMMDFAELAAGWML